MLKISEGLSLDGSTIVKLEGQVIGLWVMEIQKYCERFLDQGRPLTLDMGEVSFLDRSGVEVFKDLMSKRVKLANCTPFVTELLKTVAP